MGLLRRERPAALKLQSADCIEIAAAFGLAVTIPQEHEASRSDH